MQRAIKLTDDQVHWLAEQENRLASIRQQLALGEVMRNTYLLGATGVNVSEGNWQLDLEKGALFEEAPAE